MLAVYWKWEAVKLPRTIGVAAALNIVILLSLWDIASYQISGAVGSLTFIDALYYTVTTVTTVGYGDIIPNSEYSRLLAIAVQGIGLLIISGFAVNVISYITVKENR